ncbi:hypothetical protein B0H66DRAFT_151331 [Apodospora peruviana]|uniref:Uncharacterized protein n=1 Tax=Apodospora peruviana TaxID=516989 RepID=A0AAE0IK15_9PEZI|nr:hypothetical protein B0H66DRAFT_151331 [Apodospora peruviana]
MVLSTERSREKDVHDDSRGRRGCLSGQAGSGENRALAGLVSGLVAASTSRVVVSSKGDRGLQRECLAVSCTKRSLTSWQTGVWGLSFAAVKLLSLQSRIAMAALQSSTGGPKTTEVKNQRKHVRRGQAYACSMGSLGGLFLIAAVLEPRNGVWTNVLSGVSFLDDWSDARIGLSRTSLESCRRRAYACLWKAASNGAQDCSFRPMSGEPERGLLLKSASIRESRQPRLATPYSSSPRARLAVHHSSVSEPARPLASLTTCRFGHLAVVDSSADLFGQVTMVPYSTVRH